MSSRQEKKAQARAAREAAEAQAASAARRKRRFGMLSGAVLVAAIVVAVAVAVSSGGGGTTQAADKGPVQGVADVRTMLGGIKQNGNTLGDPKAPVTLAEFGDLKCPVCKSWDESVLPTIVNQYVRQGKVKIIYHPQAFVGEQLNPGDSPRAAKFALAAAEQDRMWSVLALFYRNQQDETTRYVSDAFLRKIGGAVPGLNVAKALKDMDSPQVAKELQQSQTQFAANGFNGTPSFLLGGPGRRLTPLGYTDVTNVPTFTDPIQELLKS